jgi:methionine-rich copper-binding protein CopC
MKHILGLAALLAVAGLAPQAALAHAMLLRAEPAVGASVSPAPSQIVLHFSEGVEPLFTTVEVLDAAGTRVDSGAPHTAAGDQKTLLVGLKPLPAGNYTVEWHATSVDTHKTQGHFSFSVAP